MFENSLVLLVALMTMIRLGLHRLAAGVLGILGISNEDERTLKSYEIFSISLTMDNI